MKEIESQTVHAEKRAICGIAAGIYHFRIIYYSLYALNIFLLIILAISIVPK